MPGLDRKQDSFQAHLLYQDKRDFELAEVVQASCSAPTYFRGKSKSDLPCKVALACQNSFMHVRHGIQC